MEALFYLLYENLLRPTNGNDASRPSVVATRLQSKIFNTQINYFKRNGGIAFSSRQ